MHLYLFRKTTMNSEDIIGGHGLGLGSGTDTSMDDSELRAWLRLVMTPRVGPGTARKLLAALGSPQAVFDAPASALAGLVTKREAQELARECQVRGQGGSIPDNRVADDAQRPRRPVRL